MTRDEILAMPAGREVDALIGGKIFAVKGYEPSQWFVMPRYSTDIAAAWQVVEEMQRRNYWFYCSVLSSFSRARFIPATPYEPRDTEVTAEVNNTPLAICRAALLAVMG